MEIDTYFFESPRKPTICSDALEPSLTASRPALGLSPRIDIIVTLLPEPDSPTTPSV